MASLKLLITLLSAIILLKTFTFAHCPKETHHKNGKKSTTNQINNPPAVGTIHPPVQPPSQGYTSPPSSDLPKQPSPPGKYPSGPPSLAPAGPSPPSSAPTGPPPGLSPSVPAPPSGQYPPGSKVTSNSLTVPPLYTTKETCLPLTPDMPGVIDQWLNKPKTGRFVWHALTNAHSYGGECGLGIQYPYHACVGSDLWSPVKNWVRSCLTDIKDHYIRNDQVCVNKCVKIEYKNKTLVFLFLIKNNFNIIYISKKELVGVGPSKSGNPPLGRANPPIKMKAFFLTFLFNKYI
ncbi:unnamed protein product [Meloidogyne enterolobii]|uniref:Uncharacterized protein n=1 Tax=Meloidogyne enterolobii TaxID=390850 RepID=A0ACB1A9D9_MELEN